MSSAHVQGPPELSPRLRQVLLLLEQGCLYKEIADRLGISNHTVKNYCERLYRKFGVHSARQAVYFYRAPLKRTPGLKFRLARRNSRIRRTPVRRYAKTLEQLRTVPEAPPY